MNCHRTVTRLSSARGVRSATVPAMTTSAGIVHAATLAAHRVSLEAHERASQVLRVRNPTAARRHAVAAVTVRSRLEPVPAGA
jgi:hypothetical protein